MDSGILAQTPTALLRSGWMWDSEWCSVQAGDASCVVHGLAGSEKVKEIGGSPNLVELALRLAPTT
jgi:hypothetical protein